MSVGILRKKTVSVGPAAAVVPTTPTHRFVCLSQIICSDNPILPEPLAPFICLRGA
jgi:hypothetical protein